MQVDSPHSGTFHVVSPVVLLVSSRVVAGLSSDTLHVLKGSAALSTIIHGEVLTLLLRPLELLLRPSL